MKLHDIFWCVCYDGICFDFIVEYIDLSAYSCYYESKKYLLLGLFYHGRDLYSDQSVVF